MTQTILQRIQTYRAEANKIIPDWYAYITDQTQPLEYRWNAFTAAPDEWTKQGIFGGIPIKCLASQFRSPYDDFNLERGQSLTMIDLFDLLKEKINGNEGLTQELYDNSREEAMANREGEWTYDW